MGVCYAIVCDKCETQIDIDKDRAIYDSTTSGIPYKVCPYRGGRAFWFLWKHKEHGDRVGMTHDHNTEDDRMFTYKEENPNTRNGFQVGNPEDE